MWFKAFNPVHISYYTSSDTQNIKNKKKKKGGGLITESLQRLEQSSEMKGETLKRGRDRINVTSLMHNSISVPPRLKNTSLKLYVQGQNLWTITNYFGLDPEFGVMNRLPPLRTYAFGFQLTF